MGVKRLEITDRMVKAFDGSAVVLAQAAPQGMDFDLDALLNSVLIPHQDRFIMPARSDAQAADAETGSAQGNEAAAHTGGGRPKKTTTP